MRRASFVVPVVAFVAPLSVADPVCPNRSVMEQRRTLRGRVTFGKPFEAVEQYVVGERHLIRREVAFEHAAVRAKLLDAVGYEGSHSLSQLFRADGRGPI